jgi:hypothetical protein
VISPDNKGAESIGDGGDARNLTAYQTSQGFFDQAITAPR